MLVRLHTEDQLSSLHIRALKVLWWVVVVVAQTQRDKINRKGATCFIFRISLVWHWANNEFALYVLIFCLWCGKQCKLFDLGDVK